MYKNCLGYYIDEYDTLLPTDTDLGPVSDTLWYKYIKPKFNDTVWADFYDREVFNNHKYPCDDTDSAYSNIVKTIKIRLINKSRIYEQMFKSFMADFNPLWNVDGVTGRILENTQTGTDTDAKSGYDTLKDTGGHKNVRSGSEDLDYLGKEAVEYKGSETDTKSGKETTEYKGSETDTKSGTETDTKAGTETHTLGGKTTELDSNTTFESTSYYPTHKKEISPTDTDTLSFTGRTDTKSFTGRTDTKSFTNRADELSFTGRTDTKSFTNRTDETSFTNRTDTHEYNNVTDTFTYDPITGEQRQTNYNSSNTKTLDLLNKDLELIIRQGNIGVTRSDELLQHALELFDNYLYDWVKYVVMDCIDQVSYAIW